MKSSLKRIGLIVSMMLFVQNAWALSIAAPKEGETFFAGSKVDVIVKPDSGENWERVLLEIVPLAYNSLTRVYKKTIELPADSIGNIVITVIAVDKSGKVIKLRRNIISRMPSGVTLQSISVNQDFMVLYKLPVGSNPTDMQRIESRQISVGGLYSDDVERDLTSSSSGTTYTSSNEKIVTVRPDGKASAQGLGTAKITVRNGKFTAQVDIDVIPYRRPQR